MHKALAMQANTHSHTHSHTVVRILTRKKTNNAVFSRLFSLVSTLCCALTTPRRDIGVAMSTHNANRSRSHIRLRSAASLSHADSAVGC